MKTKRKNTQQKTDIIHNLELVVREKFTEMKLRRILTDIGAGFCYVEYRTGEYTPNRNA